MRKVLMKKVQTRKVLNIKIGIFINGPDSPPQGYGIENKALDRVVRLGLMF